MCGKGVCTNHSTMKDHACLIRAVPHEIEELCLHQSQAFCWSIRGRCSPSGLNRNGSSRVHWGSWGQKVWCKLFETVVARIISAFRSLYLDSKQLWLQCSFLKVFVMCSEQLDCHEGNSHSCQMGWLADSPPFKVTGHQGRVTAVNYGIKWPRPATS